MCSPRFKPGPPSEDAQVLSDRLNEVLLAYVPFILLIRAAQRQRRSGILSTESLCIKRGKAVWVLYVDATCINYDGNVFDAALLAMVAALKNSAYLYSRRTITFKPSLPSQITESHI